MYKKKLINTLPLLIVVCVVTAILYGLEVHKPEAEKKAFVGKKMKVLVTQSRQQRAQLYAYSQGEVTPKQQVDIKSQVEGLIVYVSPNLVTGGRVQAGQTLLKVDDRDYKLELKQREAKVAQSRQVLERVRAQARIAVQELAQLGRDNANALAKGLPQLEHAEAELEAAKALLEQARLNLSRTIIVAPFNGIVRQESVNVGQHINRNSNLAMLYAYDVMEVNLPLNGVDLELLALPIDYYQKHYDEGIEVELTAELGGEVLSWPGRLLRTGGQFDTRTRTLNVIAEVRSTQGNTQILPGLFVSAKITGKLVNNATILPRTSVRPGNKVWYVDAEKQLQVTEVEPIQRFDDLVVVSGLADKTAVVTSSLVAPTPGMPVQAIHDKELLDNALPVEVVQNQGYHPAGVAELQ